MAPSGGSLDLWDVHFASPFKSAESPTQSLGYRWTVDDISLHPESPNCFVAVVQFSDDNDSVEDSSVIRSVRLPRPLPPFVRVYSAADRFLSFSFQQ